MNPSKLQHNKPLFGGRETAQEVHAKHAFPVDAKCVGCGSRRKLQARCTILWPMDEVLKRSDELKRLSDVDPAGFLKMVVPTKYGAYIHMSTNYACLRCLPALERGLARQPSWALVDINRGPGPDKIVVAPKSEAL